MAHSSDPSRRETTPGNQGSHAATRHLLRKKEQRRHGMRSSSPMGRVILINSPVDGGDESEDIHTITVDKSVDGRLGFSVRGGSEHGLSIFVSKVEDDSTAEQAGLCVGDKLMEVNGVSLESITMSSAVKVLTGNNRLRMVVRRVGKVPGIRYSKEKTTWVDLIHRRMVVEESGRTPSEASSDGALRRIVHLYTTSDDYCLGFNIRGGKEFGLGIYVSKLDPGGLAEQNGIKMGDQILAANGVTFDDISHSSAVEVLKSHTHVMLTIREAGRYPAYKEMVAEYRWLNKLGSASQPASSQGSDSTSSASSLSSGTPISSLSGLSQVMFPPFLPFGTDMVDVCISTEDRRSGQLGSESAETAMQTEPVAGQRLGAGDISRSLGETVFLQDTVIRVDGGRERVESPKTAVLMALSRPSKPISRSQSQVTVAEVKQKKQKKQQKGKEQERSTLQRSKTFVNLLLRGGRRRDTSRGRSKSPSRSEPSRGGERGRRHSVMPDPEMLGAVEDMARRLLTEEEVAVVMKSCRKYVTERVVENLVRHLLAVLDRPEKLLLLREVRMLVPPSDLSAFNSMVTQFEIDAYDILKYRSVRSPPLRSPRAGRAPKRHLITPIPDSCGGFELHSSEEVERESHLLEELERVRLSVPPPQPTRDRLHPPRGFNALLDVPVDGYGAEPPRPRSANPTVPNWLLAHHHPPPDPRAPPRGDIGTIRSVHFDEVSMHSSSDRGVDDGVSERGRSPFRNGTPKSKKEQSERSRDTVFTLSSESRRSRPPLSQVFGSGLDSDAEVDRAQVNGYRASPQNGLNGADARQEYELKTVSISKTKQSLGISISGGMESKVQPAVKIEKIFPGGAASTSEVLKAGFELVSVDGVSLQGVTHPHAVDIIRRAFSNKAKDPMVFIVKVPRSSRGD